MIGGTEILIIGVVVLVLFGASAVPRFARSLGQARKEFDKGLKEGGSAAEGEPKPDGEGARADASAEKLPPQSSAPEPAAGRPATRSGSSRSRKSAK